MATLAGLEATAQAALCVGWVLEAGVLVVWVVLLLQQSEARAEMDLFLISQALLLCMALAGVGAAQQDHHRLQERVAEHICRMSGRLWAVWAQLA